MILIFMGFVCMGFVFVVLDQLVLGEVQVAETAGGTNFGQVSHTSGVALPRWHHINSTGLQGLLSPKRIGQWLGRKVKGREHTG